MGDYTPVYTPGASISLTASGTASGGDLAVVSGSGTVAKAAAASAIVVGVFAHDVVSGQRCTVYGRGAVHESIADGTVTAGEQIITTATANRQVKTIGAVGAPTAQGVTDTRAAFGVALTTAADNVLVRWMEV